MSADIVYSAAALRGSRRFREAIQFVLERQKELDVDSRVPALREAFLAAEEGGFEADAGEIARMIAADEPGLPSIQKYL